MLKLSSLDADLNGEIYILLIVRKQHRSYVDYTLLRTLTVQCQPVIFFYRSNMELLRTTLNLFDST